MSNAGKIVLIAVTQRGVQRARLLRQRLRSGELHRPERYGSTENPWEYVYAGNLSEHIPQLFAASSQIVFFLAAGAVVRLIAPCLGSKESDPGVLAVDEAGRFVIPLLSGHKGGANSFARTVAGLLGATPVITTASDIVGGVSLDLLEETYGWTAEPREKLKEAARALVDGEPVTILQEIGRAGEWLNEMELPRHVNCIGASGMDRSDGALTIAVSDRALCIDPEPLLWFRPKSLVLGIGCERGLPLKALEDGLDQFLRNTGYAKASIAVLATVDLKADEDSFHQVAGKNGWQVVHFAADELAEVVEIPNPSQVVARCVGTPGVAEPAAMLAAGTKRLLVEKQVCKSSLAPQQMTFALARLASFQQPAARQGQVVFIGAGPGDPDLLTVKARRAIAGADVIVYAGSLVPEDVLRHAPPTAALHNSAPLTLEQVIAIVVDAVQAGKRVVRLHSGDTSLYSAMQEQMTLLDAAGIDYEVIPGVSSFQAAAAALKAELTLPEVVQTIILSRAEGQTPMPERETLTSLAQHRATLCLFLSARLAADVQEQLLTAYPPTTPVAVCYRVSWPDEKIIVTELQRLQETIRQHELTRTTLILVGEAVARRQNRSQLYDKNHGHIFRARNRDETHSAT